jgi:hypothetical protein
MSRSKRPFVKADAAPVPVSLLEAARGAPVLMGHLMVAGQLAGSRARRLLGEDRSRQAFGTFLKPLIG